LATVSQSTLSSNIAAATDAGSSGGGGIYNIDTTSLVLVNSTLSQNSANNNGGGIWNSGLVNLYSTSVLFNLADADHDLNGGRGGGIWNSGSFSLRHTLVAGNTATEPQAGYDDCFGTFNAYGWNLFWVVDSLACTINTMDSTWGTLSSLAVIGPLQNNGGPTWTHALLPSSNPIGNPIDAGGLAAACIDNNSIPLTTDQRGAPRSVDGDGDGVARCDIGAYEYQPPLYLPLILR
jgi:hypothetical protein